jgi:hypothetical protein
MGVLPIVLLILAMKIPIFGLVWFAFWAGRMPETEPPAEAKVRGQLPRQPEPPRRRGPRCRGPHGGGALARPLPEGVHDGRLHAPATAQRVTPAVRH